MKCRTCNGTGQVTRQRSRWIGGGKLGYRDTWQVTVACERCEGSGEDPHPRPLLEELAGTELEGQAIDALGFTGQQFLRALDRARQDGLQTRPASTPGTVAVQSGSTDTWYETSRTSCTCPATVPCKHIAWCIYLADVKGIDPAHVQTVGIVATLAKGVA